MGGECCSGFVNKGSTCRAREVKDPPSLGHLWCGAQAWHCSTRERDAERPEESSRRCLSSMRAEEGPRAVWPHGEEE